MLSLHVSQAARAAISAALIMVCIFGGLVADYAIANWRSDQAVSHSQQELCSIILLVTAHPVPKPADPAANPSRVQSYDLYEAFLTVQNQYHCS